ncbi:helix-turn-helix domain-containing protein [Flavobacterium alkalisoli]|uniref:helix-turn-helix domain-containing protein n=1 Tax=Flavobacterium alkalisoli TaxID=2602769 RepID=UPI003A956D18
MAQRDTLRHREAQNIGRMSTNIRIKKICEFCLQEFTAKKTTTKYCSHKCNSKAYKAAQRQEKIDKTNAQTSRLLTGDLEKITQREFLSITQAGRIFGISRRTIYRLIDRGHLNVAKFGSRTVLRKCDMEAFFAVPIIPQKLEPVQAFPGIEHCYTISQVQAEFNVSPAALYHLLHRHGVIKYCIGKFTYVPKAELDVIFNAVEL